MATGSVAKLQVDTTLKVGYVSELRINTSATPQGMIAELRVNAAGASPRGMVSALTVQTTVSGTRYRAIGGVWVPTSRKHAVAGSWQ